MSNPVHSHFVPEQALRKRGILSIAAGSILTAFRTLPGILAIWIVSALVGALALAAIAAPVQMSQGLDARIASALATTMAVIAFPFLMIGAGTTMGAVFSKIAGDILGQPTTLMKAYDLGFRRALPLIGSALLLKIIALVVLAPVALIGFSLWYSSARQLAMGETALQLLSIPLAVVLAATVLFALHLMARLAFTVFGTLFEDLGPIESSERAWTLSRGHSLRIGFYMLAGLAAAAGVASLLERAGQSGLIANSSSSNFQETVAALRAAAESGEGFGLLDLRRLLPFSASAVIGGLIVLLLDTALAAGLMRLYFDIRHRDEGFGSSDALAPGFRLEFDDNRTDEDPASDGLQADVAREDGFADRPADDPSAHLRTDDPSRKDELDPETSNEGDLESGEGRDSASPSLPMPGLIGGIRHTEEAGKPSRFGAESAALDNAGAAEDEGLLEDGLDTLENVDEAASDAGQQLVQNAPVLGSPRERDVPDAPAGGDSAIERPRTDAVPESAAEVIADETTQIEQTPIDSEAKEKSLTLVERLLRWLPEPNDEA